MSPINRYRRFRASFRSRLFLIFTLFTGIISAAFVFVLITGEIRNYQERSTEKTRLLASLLAGSATLPLYSENVAELTRLAKEMLATPHVAHIIITNNDKRTLVDLISPAIDCTSPCITSTARVTAASTSPSAEAALSGVRPQTTTPLGSV